MARRAQKQAERDLGLIIPHKAEKTAGQSTQEMQLEVARAINGALEPARSHDPEIPEINLSEFSLTMPNKNVAVAQSEGNIFTYNMRKGTVSVYTKEKKFVVG